MSIIAAVLVLVAGGFVIRQFATPICPRCKARRWDRKLCAPLLLCRRCATRADYHGRVYN